MSIIKVGQGTPYGTVEAGWIRYNSNANIEYTGQANYYNQAGNYQNDITYINIGVFTIRFNFTGTGIRLFAMVYSGLSYLNVILDGVSRAIPIPTANSNGNLMYEAIDLDDAVHSISIEGNVTAGWNFQNDCFDIKGSATLLAYSAKVDTVAPTFTSLAFSGHRAQIGQVYWIAKNDIIYATISGYDLGVGMGSCYSLMSTDGIVTHSYAYHNSDGTTDSFLLQSNSDPRIMPFNALRTSDGESRTVKWGIKGYLEVENSLLYAILDDRLGNRSGWYNNGLLVSVDGTPPAIASSEILYKDDKGYDVYVYGVSDGGSGVDKVQFPSWTEAGGQDDLIADWGSPTSLASGYRNMYTSAFVIYNNCGFPSSISPLVGQWLYGKYIYRLSMTPDAAQLADMQNNLWSHGVYSNQSYTFKNNTNYCVSVYWRPVSHSDIEVGLCASNMGGWIDDGTVDMGNGWKRTSAHIAITGGNKTDQLYFSYRSKSCTANVPVVIDWTCPQLEYGTVVKKYMEIDSLVVSCDEILIEFGDTSIGTTAPHGRDQYTRMGHIEIVMPDGADVGLKSNGAVWTASSSLTGTPTDTIGVTTPTTQNDALNHHMNNTGYKWYKWKYPSARDINYLRFHTGCSNANYNADDFPKTVKVTYKKAGVIVNTRFYTFPHPTNSPMYGETMGAINTIGGSTWKFHVDKASHNNEMGPYNTHIYAYDKCGNYNANTFSGLMLNTPPLNPVVLTPKSTGYTLNKRCPVILNVPTDADGNKVQVRATFKSGATQLCQVLSSFVTQNTNLIANGGFENGLTGWGVYLGASVITNTVKYGASSVEVIATNSRAYCGVNRTGVEFVPKANCKYYMSGNFYVKSFVSGAPIMIMRAITEGTNSNIAIDVTKLNQWQFKSFIWDSTGKTLTNVDYFAIHDNGITTSTFDIVTDGLAIINLTDVYGSGNEPTQAQMDIKMNDLGGWFNGSIVNPIKLTPTVDLSIGTITVVLDSYDGIQWSSTNSYTFVVSDIPSFTVQNSDAGISKLNMDALKTALLNVRTQRNLDATDFIGTVTKNDTKVLKTHLDLMRSKLTEVLTILGITPTWTDSSVVANTTLRKGVHWNEILNYLKQC